MSNDPSLLYPAPCGAICQLCLGYQRPKDTCVGCIPEGFKPMHCAKCGKKHCAEKTDPEMLCIDCPKYPCRKIKDLHKRYVANYGESLAANLEEAKRLGPEAFDAAMRAKWTCPSCGELLCVHKAECSGCGAENPRFPAPAVT